MTPPAPRPARRPAPARALAAAALAFPPLAVALVPYLLPPRTSARLVAVVGATELGPAVGLAALALGTAAALLARGRPALLAVVALAVGTTVALVAYPVAGTARAAREAAAAVAALPPRGGGSARPPERAAPVALLDVVRGLPRRPTVAVRPVRLAAADGSPLELRLFRDTAAADRGSRPAVVVVYGGAWQRGDASQAQGVSRWVAGLGYHVLAIDYRHAPRHPYPAAVDDVRRALALLRDSAAAWGVDPERVALWGRSAGAHLALLAAWGEGADAPPLPLRGVIDYYGPFDLARGYAILPSPDPIDVRAVLRDFVGGPPAAVPARYRAASPSTYVRPGLPPTLLVYGRRDHVVLARFGREAAAALRDAGSPVVHLELPWAEHGFDLGPAGPDAQAALFVVERFLARVLD